MAIDFEKIMSEAGENADLRADQILSECDATSIAFGTFFEALHAISQSDVASKLTVSEIIEMASLAIGVYLAGCTDIKKLSLKEFRDSYTGPSEIFEALDAAGSGSDKAAVLANVTIQDLVAKTATLVMASELTGGKDSMTPVARMAARQVGITFLRREYVSDQK